ncbi:hypothetical protein F4777DRAFT_187766 [Nemania sp. FL0916]|nr:hypothetical protein F4777DRAFT_187766 [Nemania sp. FL0916]
MATSASALAQLKQFTLRSRSLFIKCVPAPGNFYERRAVLAALQQASQQSIETFKRLQDSSSFIAITTIPEAASSLIGSSPLERTLALSGASHDEAAIRPSWGDSSGSEVTGRIAAPVHLLPAASAGTAAKPTPASADLELAFKTFTLHIFRINKNYDHVLEVRKHPLHGPWPGDGKTNTETYISSALRRVVPSGPMAPALRDWETGNQLARDSSEDSFAGDSSEGAAATFLGKKRLSTRESFILERIRQRSAKRETPKIMDGIFQFAEECKAKSAEPQPESGLNTATQDSRVHANELSSSNAKVERLDTPESNTTSQLS